MTILLRQKPLPQVVRQIVQRDNGVWLDASDMSTMYQDEAGTIPVTALEQPVGLWLDKSQGLQLGPELVTNGTFDTNIDGWSNIYPTRGSLTWNSTNKSLRIDNTTGAGDAYVYTSVAVTAGKIYRFRVKVTDISGGMKTPLLKMYWHNGTTHTTSFSATNAYGGYYEFNYAAYTGSIGFILGTTYIGGGGVWEIDDISVRELKGNHATQSITASRPTLSARYNLLLNSATLSTQSVTTVAAPYTLSVTGTGSVTLSGSATGTLVGTGANNRVSLAFTPTAGTLTLTVTGSVTLAMLAFGTLTTYQAITTATSYDSVGWSRYVRFDGIDDYLNLPYMGLYANGSASVVMANALFPSSSNVCVIAEGNDSILYTQYSPMRQTSNSGFTDNLILSNTGETILDVIGSGLLWSDANSRVVSSVDNGSNMFCAKNSTTLFADNYLRDKTATFTNTIIGGKLDSVKIRYLANMNLYGLLITKSALSDSDRRKCEVYLARKAGVQL